MFFCGRCETQGERIELQLAEGEESRDLSNGMLMYVYIYVCMVADDLIQRSWVRIPTC